MQIRFFNRLSGWCSLIPALILLSACQSTANISAPVRAQAQTLIRVGDSTMAPNSGYGNALCAQFSLPVSCLNLAKGGRSSGSYRAEGSWEQVMKTLKALPAGQQGIVLLQFGHNDQPGKPGRSTDLQTEYPVNLQGYIRDVRAAGGDIVLVTPLARRTFKDGILPNDLRPWALSMIAVATQEKVALIDLNMRSHQLLSRMGQDEADTLAMVPKPVSVTTAGGNAATEPQGTPKSAFDRTHVGVKGAELFSGMVVQELVSIRPSLASSLIQKGEK